MTDAATPGRPSLPPRGRLKILLGAAPGVGKTYAMLDEGRRRAARGTDVVVALVETHDRPETAALLAGLEIIPPRCVVYRGMEVSDLDLDAVLRRHPQVALVDELAQHHEPQLPPDTTTDAPCPGGDRIGGSGGDRARISHRVYIEPEQRWTHQASRLECIDRRKSA
ncbi:Osmosensitive K+ channel His kinase sensor domain-containing protein [Raineyella antarctica]|uniref:Osmosensitive K+ channel His kinase sensor domain-containing protein n=1 Tax=Raineyella antarctica TaxID=1577474 RepID=A0A1G6GCQ5_9ACTN|nr:hypothetical protein [Raineyella antarctica]SDB79754.1 Osmosensitive K+ channel His kinase sensor domain-containing protein [Raineyella antarctica]